jgi:hypothetical protein
LNDISFDAGAAMHQARATGRHLRRPLVRIVVRGSSSVTPQVVGKKRGRQFRRPPTTTGGLSTGAGIQPTPDSPSKIVSRHRGLADARKPSTAGTKFGHACKQCKSHAKSKEGGKTGPKTIFSRGIVMLQCTIKIRLHGAIVWYWCKLPIT